MPGSSRFQLVGGPLCGCVTAAHSGPFVWFSPTGTRGVLRSHSEPGAGRLLYRQLPGGTYVYAGHTYAVCGGCGAIASGGGECHLCGASLRP